MKWLPKIRFSMRTLFILVTVLCVLLVPVSVKLYQARQQRLAVEWVLENDGYIVYDYQLDEDGTFVTETPTDNLWLRSILGNDFFDTPVDVTIANPTITDISNLSHLQSLETVHIVDPENVDLSPLGSLKNLDSCFIKFSSEKSFTAKHIAELSKLDCSLDIYLDGQFMDDLTLIQQLSNIRELAIYDSQVTDLAPLIHLDQLESLTIEKNPVKDISPLSDLTQLKKLYINNPNITDLTPLGKLINMRSLSLSTPNANDFSPLFKLSKLKVLYHPVNFPEAEIKRLEKVLPNCNVSTTYFDEF
ncbi:MAG: hypothetical protein COA78_17705 [Blastopirellula sp.]|nr:MAG: hypothetical protein COA78_17705 [Blastopirellula sp.]